MDKEKILRDRDIERTLGYIQSGDTQYLIEYLKEGGDPNLCDNDSESLLHVAVSHYRVSAINALITHGANVNSQTPNGLTPLHFACQLSASDNIIEQLLKNGANINARTKVGRTPVMLCAIDFEHIQTLLKYQPDLTLKDHEGNTALDLAISFKGHERFGRAVALLESAMEVQRLAKTIELRQSETTNLAF